ncbi:MAG: anti-phage dCTP deaminase [Pseudomonadota bacterium]
MSEFPEITYPEIIVGVAGPIGIDIDEINRSLTHAFDQVGYKSVAIRITEEIKDEITQIVKPKQTDFGSEISYKMSHASAVCRKYKSADTLMRFAVKAIRKYRTRELLRSGEKIVENENAEEKVVPSIAYIIRQLKRPEEVHFLRKIYGKQFVLVSAYGSHTDRKKRLEKSLKKGLPTDKREHEISALADQIIHRDQNEDVDSHGQHLRDTFHLADVFIDGISRTEMNETIGRFVEALFGKADIAPTRSEYGMYAAKSASLRSSDLSRQVGAAIFTPEGEIVTQGCNEVPKANGGTYWDGDELDYRDVKLGQDPNDLSKREIIRDLIERMSEHDLLSEHATAFGSAIEITHALLTTSSEDKSKGRGALKESSAMELTEYGRVVHAEMSAICDAARIGRSLKNMILFCTTFPCHNCTKHLLAAGICEVIYMEPYPKSKAKELHENEIELEKRAEHRVAFLPFIGIAPARYREIFQKGKRKGGDGQAKRWIHGEPRPSIDLPAITYTDLESFELMKMHEDLRQVSD